ncbi:MAG TPA: tetratricopeptide repeat protein [Thermoflexia bacterium]|nr:tetratricopeptide repeat protein [Thermoflexia bacterium]
MGWRWWGGIVSAFGLLLILGLGLAPYGLSVYHLEAGGRALDAALVPVFPDRLAPEQVVDEAELAAGMAHLEEAVRWDSRNVQALRLLARGYVSLGESEAALEVLQQALAVRPRNPLVHLELGDVYDSIGDAEAAVREYEAGRIGSRSLPAAANYLKLADAQASYGSGELAILFWRKALALDPGNLYALYRLFKAHRDLGDIEQAAVYEERLRYFELESVAVPLDFRLAEYQGRAMVGLVEEGIWDRQMVLDVVAYQVEQFSEGVQGLMVERELEVMLEAWVGDGELLAYKRELESKVGGNGE